MSSTQTQPQIINDFVERYYIALYGDDEADTEEYQTQVTQFKTVFTKLTTEMKLSLTHHSGVSQAENRQAFKERSQTQGANWKALTPADQEVWKAIAKRVDPSKAGGRKPSGWDCYRTFKGELPPIGDGVSKIVRPTK
jgi:uncharacterized lipoprotein YmbA